MVKQLLRQTARHALIDFPKKTKKNKKKERKVLPEERRSERRPILDYTDPAPLSAPADVSLPCS